MAAKPVPEDILQQALDAATAHGSKEAGAQALGVPASTIKSRIRDAERRGLKPTVQRLIAIEPASPPEGYRLKGTSTYYNADGVPTSQWVKTTADGQRLEEMQKAAFVALSSELPAIARIAAPKATDAALLNLYTMTDCHVGMLAWGRETGEPWDLQIAEQTLARVFLRMIDAAPNAELGVVNQLGDFLHFDSMVPETPAHKHVLDADSRYQKMVEVAVRILRRVIEAALKKHKRVQVYMHEGNHDPAGSVWLRVMFAALYGNNPRVRVEQSPLPYAALQHGNTFLGFHHGHMLKPASMPMLFAAKFPEIWGSTKSRYIHCGHRHHVEEREHPGVFVVQHPTLAAADAYAARGGWLSKRQATLMVYDRNQGEVARSIYVP